jgi:hypothetical protein
MDSPQHRTLQLRVMKPPKNAPKILLDICIPLRYTIANLCALLALPTGFIFIPASPRGLPAAALNRKRTPLERICGANGAAVFVYLTSGGCS